jgi:hypothetical protein
MVITALECQDVRLWSEYAHKKMERHPEQRAGAAVHVISVPTWAGVVLWSRVGEDATAMPAAKPH